MRDDDLKSMSTDNCGRSMKKSLWCSAENYKQKKQSSSNGNVSFKGPTTCAALPFRRSIEIQRTQLRAGPVMGSNPDGLNCKFKLADGWMIS